MKIIDISWPLTKDMTGYKNQNVFSIKQVKTFARDAARETAICLSSHSGTHVDAPSHFLLDGKTIDNIALQKTIGLCKVIDCSGIREPEIKKSDLCSYEINKGDIILIKTRNSNLAPTTVFNDQFVYLQTSAAEYLAAKEIQTVGIDYLGIERNQPGHQTHTILMKQHISIIEGLRLKDVDAGTYFLVCLPLKVLGLEAAPARAILFD